MPPPRCVTRPRPKLAVVLDDGEIAATAGATVSPQLGRHLLAAAEHGRDRATLPGGDATLAAARLHGSAGWLVVARHGAPFAAQARELVTGAARVLDLHRRLSHAADAEAELRREGEREIRARQRAERELAHQSLHDALTGLPNFRLLHERAVYALDQARHGRVGHVAVLFVDIASAIASAGSSSPATRSAPPSAGRSTPPTAARPPSCWSAPTSLLMSDKLAPGTAPAPPSAAGIVAPGTRSLT